jgi:hypothetical protein
MIYVAKMPKESILIHYTESETARINYKKGVQFIFSSRLTMISLSLVAVSVGGMARDE